MVFEAGSEGWWAAAGTGSELGGGGACGGLQPANMIEGAMQTRLIETGIGRVSMAVLPWSGEGMPIWGRLSLHKGKGDGRAKQGPIARTSD